MILSLLIVVLVMFLTLTILADNISDQTKSVSFVVSVVGLIYVAVKVVLG